MSPEIICDICKHTVEKMRRVIDTQNDTETFYYKCHGVEKEIIIEGGSTINDRAIFVKIGEDKAGPIHKIVYTL